MSKNIVAWHFKQNVSPKKIPELELLAETISATIDTTRSTEDAEFIETHIFVDNFPHLDTEILKEEIAKITQTEVTLEPIYEENWEEKCISDFPPLEIGSFFIHSFDEKTPNNKISLKIPAQMAFGTGEHATTKGCLTLYDILAEKGFSFKNGLDMGCGSAILAIAAVKKGNVMFLGVDNDEKSVEVASENIKLNKIKNNIDLLVSEGFSDNLIQQRAPYDLIFANILKNPLLRMATDIVTSLDENGIVILSGFREGEQTQEIIDKFVNELNLTLLDRFCEDGWSTLALKK